MLKKTVTYTNYNGVEVTEDFYFNLTKAELMKMEMGVAGGLVEALQKVIDAKNAPAIIEFFEKLVLDSYGEKSADGRRFIKNQEIRDSFAQTEAYSDIFMALATDDKAAAEFVNGIIPADLAKQVADEQAKAKHPANKK